MGAVAYQITSLAIVYLTVYSGADLRKYQSSASLSFVPGIHRWPVNSPHKGTVMRKMFPSSSYKIIDTPTPLNQLGINLPYSHEHNVHA